MDEHGFSFVMMVKGCRFRSLIVDEKRDTFEAVEHAMRAHDQRQFNSPSKAL